MFGNRRGSGAFYYQTSIPRLYGNEYEVIRSILLANLQLLHGNDGRIRYIKVEIQKN